MRIHSHFKRVKRNDFARSREKKLIFLIAGKINDFLTTQSLRLKFMLINFQLLDIKGSETAKGNQYKQVPVKIHRDFLVDKKILRKFEDFLVRGESFPTRGDLMQEQLNST